MKKSMEIGQWWIDLSWLLLATKLHLSLSLLN